MSEKKQFYEGLNQVTLVPGDAAVGTKRGKGAGFYCEYCNLTFKDSIDYSDHLISKQHIYNAGIELVTKPATLEDVRKRLEMLRKKTNVGFTEYDILRVLKEKREKGQAKRASIKRKRQESSGKLKEDGGSNPAMQESEDVASLMGFSSFASTK